MMKDRRQRMIQAAVCFLCVIIVWRYRSPLEGTEFSEGKITGLLLDLSDIGAVLFALGAILALAKTRLAAAVAVAASVLTLPLYLYFAAPGLFRWFVRGEYSVPLQNALVWDMETISGIVLLAVATYVSGHNLSGREEPQSRNLS